ncbi:TetR family transcriptional regulator [Sulfurifustis variabilis]|uniref:TetR family transcriptional regulator n=1 Tax=Sulfurifustis variabilis TaxID=1675686 RepID=A0A1B4V726_9GAMM|nr:TetR/AcrR family transcriptional regulator [Sulfurifustis variabilis]BAU47104.1 TetR family transcriptional regulator [Sulfurifustis variabilis]
MAVTRDTIVDEALGQAERASWEAVRLRRVASALGVSLEDVWAHFREKEDIVDAWFDRADKAMLTEIRKPGFPELGARERLERSLLAWLAALAPHRRVTRQMILNKLEPGHVHYQVAGALRVSRTVQWLREAVGRDATLPWRAVEETALTSLYLAVFFRWMWDDSPGAERTRAFLRRSLDWGTRACGRAPVSAPGTPRRRSETGAGPAGPAEINL